MIDWTGFTKNPVDPDVCGKLRSWLLDRRKTLPSNDCDDFLITQVRDKTVLDIGVGEHTIERVKSKK